MGHRPAPAGGRRCHSARKYQGYAIGLLLRMALSQPQRPETAT